MKKTNKILAALTSTALLCGAIGALPASAEETNVLRGDVDRNGVVNSLDAIYVLRYVADKMLQAEAPGDPLCTYDLEIADISNNGEINCLDAVLILKYYAHSLLYHGENFPTIDAFFQGKITENSYPGYVADTEKMIREENNEK